MHIGVATVECHPQGHILMLRKRVYAKASKKAAKKPKLQKALYPRSDLGPELKYLDSSAVGTYNYSGSSPGILL